MRWNRVYITMLLICITVLGGCKGQDSVKVQETELLEIPEETEKEEQENLIYVQVSGAVDAPGVYTLPEGSRLFEAVELAGGVTDEADISKVNQAQMLSDGQMVYIMKQGEAEHQEEAQPEDGRVNLNMATEEQLMTLTGIGQAKAKSIIAWREENGAFSKIEDLMEIEGIKEGVFSKIKDSIKVN